MTSQQSGQYLLTACSSWLIYDCIDECRYAGNLRFRNVVGEPEGPFWVHLWRLRNWNLAMERQPGAMSFGTCDAAELYESLMTMSWKGPVREISGQKSHVGSDDSVPRDQDKLFAF